MKGTGSNTIVAKDVFVPEHRFLPYPQAFAGSYRTEFNDEVVYRVDLVPVTVLILAGSQIGVARAALEHVVGKSRTRGITHTNFADTGGVGRLSDAGRRRGDEDRHSHAARAASRGRSRSRAERRRHMDLTERAQSADRYRARREGTAATPWKCSWPRTARRAWPTPIVCSACGVMCTPPAITRSPSGR